MARSRPCLVCSQVFTPNPRAGDRQKTCSRPDCQRERHRRNCVDWRGRHPGYDRAYRLGEQLPKTSARREKSLARNPIAEIAWDTVRDSVGPLVQLVVQRVGDLVVEWARDAVTEEMAVLRRKLAEFGEFVARDAFVTVGEPP
ncbi:MAG: hypothetical protein GY772_28435 [bacterium]|nr:hypothetical protein [bacterium]